MTEIMSTSLLRENAYRLLAACYYPPTESMLEESCCDHLAGLLDHIAADAAWHAREAGKSLGSNVEALAVEHARLFIGPFHVVAPPYGSVYLDDSRSVMGASTARVAALYQSNGLQLAEDFHELPDHIAVELEFMSYLAHKQSKAAAEGNLAETKRIAEEQREFLAAYLLPWLKPFTNAIINDGEAPFYQAVARCTAEFVAADYQSLAATDNG